MRKNYTPWFFRKLLLSFVSLLIFLQLSAQVDIGIGTGTTGNVGNSLTNGYPCPMQDYYEGSRAQYLYQASELITAGMGPGNINAIKYNVINLNDFSGEIQEYTVRIGSTSVASLSATAWESVPNTVLGPVNFVPVSGVNTLTFSAPFFWNGVDNIIVEICNGDPGNATGTHWTQNVTVPWTTGLSFNGSHNLSQDNAGNLCGATAANNAGTQTTRPDIAFNWTPASACSGMPEGGTATSSILNILCPGGSFVLSLAGSTVASGLTYQWQSSPDNSTWSPIAGATSFSFTTTQAGPVMYYRNVVTCSNGSQADASASVQVTNASGPTYASLPFTESFEPAWVNTCNSREIPNNSWRNTPGTGNNSWRRNDDGGAAAWTNAGPGNYTPAATAGNFSARFHSYNATSNSTGVFDLHLDCNTAATVKRLSFDFINTSGTDSLSILLSTNGGGSFTRLDSAGIAAAWISKSIVFSSSSATTIIRIAATSDDGTTDIGLDNVRVTDFDNCAGTPSAGTVTSSLSNVCLTTPFTLTATGATDANGLVYQWQYSTDNGTTWLDISGANGFTYTTTQGVTTIYRFKVTCSFGGAFATSGTVQVTSPPLPDGTYTINSLLPTDFATGGTNFQSFSDAYAAMLCGINGPVVFNVSNGPYNEQLIMGAIPGTSATNTITFNGNGARLGFASSNSNERAVIKLRGTKHVIFDSLVIDAGAGTYGYGVQLISDADSNAVRKCTITTSVSSTTQNYAGIVINGTEAGPVGTGVVLCDYNVFSGNTITGGYYGITLVATFTGGANGFNEFTGNDVRDFYLYGIYAGGSYNTLIEGNTFSRPARTTVGEFNGIYFTTQNNTARVSKNRITNPFGGSPASTSNFYGIFFNNSSASATNDNIVSNNLIYNINGNGPVYGIANTGSGNAWYVHNTISLDNTASSSSSVTRGIQQLSAAGGLIFFNNIITITRGGTGQKHCIYLGSGLPLALDYNDYYINAAAGTNYTGFYTGNRISLNDWQTATSQDAASISVNPVYTDPLNGNYSPGNAGIDNKGLYINIDTDINGVTRSQATPDIGAYEFVPPPCSIPPVNGTASLSAATVCQNTAVLLSLDIGAYGSGQTFQWESSPSLAGPFTAIGTAMLSPDTTILSTTTLYYRAAVSCLSSTEYSDTVLLTVTPGFPGGAYTINKNIPTNYVPGTAGANFNSFNDARIAMSSCGILGPVVFNVAPGTGPYDEQLKIDSTRGVSAVNTITFNGNGNTLQFSSANSNERAVIKLNTADHIIFDSLVIDASSGVYGYGVQLIDNADSNTFRKCIIITSTAASSLGSNYAGVVINSTDAGPVVTGNTLCDGNLFDRNTITGGYYGVTLVGNTGSLVNDNKFTNNLVQDFYSTGFYLSGTYNTLIEGNTLTRPTRSVSASPLYGIFVTTASSNNLTISKNRFTRFFGGNPASTSIFYGVNHNSVDATAGSEAVVSNNLFYGLDGNGSVYPLYNTGSDNVVYYHNTISIDNTASTATSASAGFYQTGSATGIQFKNNIVTVRSGGTGTKHAVYLATASSEVEFNNNDYYLDAAGSNNFIGFSGSNQLTLADWQTASGADANSLNVDPLYASPSTGNFSPSFLPLDNKGVAVGIMTDILNAARSATTPDIGAYEFVPVICTSPPVAGVATVTATGGVCLETPITLNLAGNSPIGTITFQWQHSSNGTDWTNLSDVLYTPEFNTIATTSNQYRAAVTCNGVTVLSTVVTVTLNPVLLEGTYTINNASPTTYVPGVQGGNFNSFQAAVNALLCGITGPVAFEVADATYSEQIRIPYIPNTSVINTVTFVGISGNTAAVNLTNNSTATNSNYTLKLDSARYFIFKGMTITATNTSFGRALELAGEAAYDSILNCIITAPAVTSSSNNAAGLFAIGLKGGHHVIKGNTINNGASGIYLAGTSATELTGDNSIEDNTINGAYYSSLYTGYNKRVKITGNSINVASPVFTTAYGLYAEDCDSSYQVTGNQVVISNNASLVYGIYVADSDSATDSRGRLASNKVTAVTGNTGNLHGLHIKNSPGIDVVNNVISINTTGASSYGLYNDNSNAGNYWNNSVHSTATSATNNYAAYFINTSAPDLNIRNNIFSHKGGGKAIFASSTSQAYACDYNMLYTTGSILAQRGAPAGTFATLDAWKTGSYWDVNSIVISPAFVSDDDLRPALGNPDVWAMHGRGVQIPANAADFNNDPRPTTLTTGVPDLGAYEFYPTALPSVLVPIPATPAPNTKQSFMYGTDTVMQVTWGAAVPPGVEVRRYSGVVPTGLTPGMDSMYFYTEVSIPGGGNYNYSINQFYIDPWQGSIPEQHMIGLGKTTPSNAWVVGFTSVVNVPDKRISQTDLTYIDKFTGLVNPYAPPVLPDKDSSNRGRRFWVAYGHHQGFSSNGQDMVLYLSAQQPANVQVRINGTNWVRNYLIPANSAIVSDIIPKLGAEDARLMDEGLYTKGISITSDEPIEAYAHIYQGSNSGATMLMPVGVYGYEYITLNSRQYYASNCYSWFYAIADNDNTVIEIIPSVATKGGRPADVPFTVTLNKGEVYQVMGTTSGSTGTDLTGSKVRSVPNASGVCYPIAVFSGSSRTAICYTSNGDNIMQQVFPYSAWGKKYATFASANSTSNTLYNSNMFRVMVKDPATVVKRNGTVLTGMITPGNYYEFSTTQGNGPNGANYIEADKPVLMAQYMVSTSANQCPGVTATGNGDPELIYISPIEQGINKAVFYSTDESAINSNYINVVIPDEGLASLMIDGGSSFTDVFAHPSLPGYTCIRHNLGATAGQHLIQSDKAFTAFTYGLGSVESYGYNAGTLVRTLQASGAISNSLSSTGDDTEFTCVGSPFTFKALIPLKPVSLLWKFSQVANLTPNADVLLANPVASDSVMINGTRYYEFTTPLEYTFATAGIYPVQIEFEHPDVESCDNKEISIIYVQVLPAPKTFFSTNFSGCVNDVAQFEGEGLTENGLVVSHWQWTFHDATTVNGQNASFTYTVPGTYNETLRTITPDGCLGDSTREVLVNPRPEITVTDDSLSVCSGADATFTIQNPEAGTVYTWYTTATGGTAVATGDSYTVTGVIALEEYYVEAISAAGCASTTRKRVVVSVSAPGSSATITVSNAGADYVTFSWAALPGASAYEVAVNGGAFGPPSSGATGLTHTVSGMGTLQSVSLVLKVINSCGESLSAPVNGCSNSEAAVTADSLAVCNSGNAVFNVQSPEAGITYTWYNEITGGSSLATGNSFTLNNITADANYYLQHESVASGCIGTPRTRLVVAVLPGLGQVVATVDSIAANLLRFSWNAVPGAVSYQVSLDNGATFITPSSGATGLTHTVANLIPLQEVTLIVKATGAASCDPVLSAAVSGRTLGDDIFIPNTFTPNGDGVNDQLRVYATIIRETTFMVFNQWGEKIFESRDQAVAWDGTYKGRPQPSGVYMYVARFVLRDGTEVDRKGAINLIR